MKMYMQPKCKIKPTPKPQGKRAQEPSSEDFSEYIAPIVKESMEKLSASEPNNWKITAESTKLSGNSND